MDERIRNAMKHSLSELRGIQEKVDDFMDELPPEVQNIRGRAQKALRKIRDRLDDSLEQAGINTEEAELQAHLGLMEAQDKLESSREVLDKLVEQGKERSKTLIDEAELQGNLAMMEAQDFWETRGKDLAADFMKSAETMQTKAMKAANDLQDQLKHWNDESNRKDD
jgi:ElaB/YqjD/DUF883 family membrane-anchored ribosome-binding protein